MLTLIRPEARAAEKHHGKDEVSKKDYLLLAPLGDRIGPLNFQFEYLNKQKMGGVGKFVEKFGEFAEQLPTGFKYCVEIRNPNYLPNKYFHFEGSAPSTIARMNELLR